MKKAFKEGAALSRREVAVIAKGLSAKKLRDVHNKGALAEKLRKDNTSAILKCKKSLPRSERGIYRSLILYISSVTAAKELYNNGLI